VTDYWRPQFRTALFLTWIGLAIGHHLRAAAAAHFMLDGDLRYASRCQPELLGDGRVVVVRAIGNATYNRVLKIFVQLPDVIP
jgi:hypothetical protein